MTVSNTRFVYSEASRARAALMIVVGQNFNRDLSFQAPLDGSLVVILLSAIK